MKVALISSLEAVPWIPIVAGLLEGFRLLEEVTEAQAFRISGEPWHHLLELERFKPDLVLFPNHRAEWKWTAPYLKVIRDLPGVRTAAITFDDPYDMETGLAMGKELGFVFTPELLAVDVYERQGIPARHLLPTMSLGLHFPDTANPVAPYAGEVLQVGGTGWRPRNRWLPIIWKWCQANGKRFHEVTGGKSHGWLVGRELSAYIHAARVVLEIPRFDLPSITNPHQVPCTCTGPRVYLVAACGGLPLVIGPRQDLGDVFPDANYVDNFEFALESLEYWTSPDQDARRQDIGGLLFGHFIKHHRPQLRAAQIVRQLELGDGALASVAPVPRTRRQSPGDQTAHDGSKSPQGEAIANAPGTPPPG